MAERIHREIRLIIGLWPVALASVAFGAVTVRLISLRPRAFSHRRAHRAASPQFSRGRGGRLLTPTRLPGAVSAGRPYPFQAVVGDGAHP